MKLERTLKLSDWLAGVRRLEGPMLKANIRKKGSMAFYSVEEIEKSCDLNEEGVATPMAFMGKTVMSVVLAPPFMKF
jgi:hypothetical protein